MISNEFLIYFHFNFKNVWFNGIFWFGWTLPILIMNIFPLKMISFCRFPFIFISTWLQAILFFWISINRFDCKDAYLSVWLLRGYFIFEMFLKKTSVEIFFDFPFLLSFESFQWFLSYSFLWKMVFFLSLHYNSALSIFKSISIQKKK